MNIEGENASGASETREILTTLCKSSTDDFLQCEALNVTGYDPENLASVKSLQQKSNKIRSQEIDMNYPCLIYNIGLRKICVQSAAIPNVVSLFDLPEGFDFLAFA